MLRIRTAAPLFAIAVVLALPRPVRAQNLTGHPRVVEALNLLERWIDAHRAYEQIPGVSAAVVHDQELLWSRGFGYADLERERAATPETIYSICSISKLFTSVAAMQLRDEGRFALDTEVGELLPWFELRNAHPESPDVTVEGLLTHAAGLPRESDYPYWSRPFDFPTHEQVVERLVEQETLYPTWERFQYSNLGLTLVGEIVAGVSGVEYGAYVRDHILGPLGMESTTPEIGTALGSEALATGYSAMRRGGERERVTPFEGRGIAPAMGYASTVEDLARFASWQFRLLEDGGDEILAANTLREMHRVHYVDPDWEVHRGLGFSVWRRNDQTFVGHGGSCPGYRSSFQLQTDSRVATVAMVNAMVDASLYARRAHEIVAPAIEEALADEDGDSEALPAPFERYLGAYDGFPWGGETQVVPWKGGLATVSFPTDDPLAGLTRLEHVQDHSFRRVREDGTLAEEVVFEVNQAGDVTGMRRHSNVRPKIR